MQIPYTYSPVRFFLSTLLVTGAVWFAAAYCSYQPGMAGAQFLLLLAGLFVPFAVAMFMIFGANDMSLRQDFWERLHWNKIKTRFIPLLVLLLPAVLILATAISVLLGHAAGQFAVGHEYGVLSGSVVVSLLLLVLAPIFEELGWRGYGVDSLRSRCTLWTTSVLFAALWALWHAPLFFVSGYYHHILWETSIVYVINFFVSMLPAAFLMNWVYFKNNRSIIAAIILHFMFDFCAVILQTEQFTKCIITVLLLGITAVIVVRDRKFFFSPN
jgi:uncharacterized protein